MDDEIKPGVYKVVDLGEQEFDEERKCPKTLTELQEEADAQPENERQNQ